ncbi:hypothetical protein WMF27_07125 [Sorangium sp. So ce281]|uniref:hypothetical protein n=1 Tax=unclassified Sorangium TaxID=2621164 RepID=UPI003F5E1AED
MQLDDPRHEYNPYAAPTTDDARSYGEDEQDEHVLAERGTRFGARILDNLLLVGSAIPVMSRRRPAQGGILIALLAA